MYKKKQVDGPSGTSDALMGQRMSMKSIMKDIEQLGTSRMSWKEKKELENRKVLSLGGKPQRNPRLSIREAGHIIKKQKKQEKKIIEEQLILGRFGAKLHGGTKKTGDRRRPEDRVLKTSEGTFRNGILDVKHLLKSGSSRESSSSAYVFRGDDMMGHDGKKKHGKSNGRGGGKGGRGRGRGGGGRGGRGKRH